MTQCIVRVNVQSKNNKKLLKQEEKNISTILFHFCKFPIIWFVKKTRYINWCVTQTRHKCCARLFSSTAKGKKNHKLNEHSQVSSEHVGKLNRWINNTHSNLDVSPPSSDLFSWMKSVRWVNLDQKMCQKMWQNVVGVAHNFSPQTSFTSNII